MNTTKKLTTVIITSLLVLLPNAQALAENNWNTRVSALFGQKKLDNKYFEDTSHGACGISFDIKPKNWPVSIAIDLLAAGKEETTQSYNIERVTGGLHLGVKKYWLVTDNIEPYLGGGINLAVAERKKLNNNLIETQDDSGTGYWVATGVNWRFDNKFTVGAEVRYSDAEVTLFNSEVKTGGLYSMLSVGYRF